MSLASISSNREDYNRHGGWRGGPDTETSQTRVRRMHWSKQDFIFHLQPAIIFCCTPLETKGAVGFGRLSKPPFFHVGIYTHREEAQQPTPSFANLIYHPPFFLYCFWNSLCYLFTPLFYSSSTITSTFPGLLFVPHILSPIDSYLSSFS